MQKISWEHLPPAKRTWETLTRNSVNHYHIMVSLRSRDAFIWSKWTMKITWKSVRLVVHQIDTRTSIKGISHHNFDKVEGFPISSLIKINTVPPNLLGFETDNGAIHQSGYPHLKLTKKNKATTYIQTRMPQQSNKTRKNKNQELFGWENQEKKIPREDVSSEPAWTI